jgi:hypothetical protein
VPIVVTAEKVVNNCGSLLNLDCTLLRYVGCIYSSAHVKIAVIVVSNDRNSLRGTWKAGLQSNILVPNKRFLLFETEGSRNIVICTKDKWD